MRLAIIAASLAGCADVIGIEQLEPLSAPECTPFVPHALTSGHEIALADFTGDERQEIVVLAPDRIEIIGIGTGAVTETLTYASDDHARLAIADFNRDGLLDLAIATTKGVDVFLRVGQGEFGARTTIAIPEGIPAIAVADVDGDGAVDVVVSDLQASRERMILVALNRTLAGAVEAAFAPNLLAGATSSGATGLAAADLDGDGRADLLVVDPEHDGVQVFHTIVAGSSIALEAPVLAGGPTAGTSVAVTTGSANNHLAATGSGLAQLWVPGDGPFGMTGPFPLADGEPPADAVVLADLEHATMHDVAIARRNVVELYRADSATTLVRTSRIEVGADVATRRLLVGNLDGDDKPDLVVLGEDGQVVALTPTGHCPP